MGAVQSQSISNETVKDLDISRYMGTWYEIAKYPFKWEDDCAGATAQYRWNELDQKILVTNTCLSSDGSVKRKRTAKAWIPDQNDKGKILIEFEGYPRDMGPGDYWVHWTDYDNYAIVGGPSGQFLWLLSRKPTIRASEVEPMLERIASFGYNTDRLMSEEGIVTN